MNDIIDKLSDLAKLYISEDEKQSYQNDMEKIIKYVDNISTLDTENVDALIDTNDSENVLRKDEICESGLKYSEDAFVVPKTIE